MKLPQLLFFWLIATIVLGTGHLFLYRRLVRDAEWSPRIQRFLTILLVGWGASLPILMLTSRALPRSVISPFAFVGYVWMGLLSSVFTLLLLTELFRFVARRFNRKPQGAEAVDEPERRRTFRRLLSGGVTAAGAALTGVGVVTALAKFSVKPVEVTLDKLPRGFDGFRIVQLSDIHVGPTIGREYVERMVETANSLGADLIAITGDLVDGSVAHLGRHTEPLRHLKAEHGVYFVTGNHEYYSGADEWVEELDRLGIPTLRNRRVEIRRGDAAFDLAGVTDHRAGQFDDAPDFERTLAGRDSARELVLLAHQPAAIRDAQKHDVGLQLSGHTHAGQFWPWSWVVHLVQPVVAGLARFGRTQIYVNQGTGYWGPPVRIGTEPEITLVTLRSSAHATS